MILAAGFATRLRPFTEHTPKALFPLAGRPLVDRIIEALAGAGCTAIVVNTHHLAERIESHLARSRYPVPVDIRREESILGTGGGVKNASAFFNDRPFLVVNGDIDTDIDYAALYRFHLSHPHPATLALVDWPEVNTVSVTEDGRITGFDPPPFPDAAQSTAGAVLKRTFAGVQVLDPSVLKVLPQNRFSSIIDAYRALIAGGQTVFAYPFSGRWSDLGTPGRYLQAAAERGAALAFNRAFSGGAPTDIRFEPLAGDGSQRQWTRLRASGRSMVMVSHGIRRSSGTEEVDAFVDIGRHLEAKGVPVPEIYWHDRFSGLVFVEDAGDKHLETAIGDAEPTERIDLYRRVIDSSLHMGLAAAEGFDPSWAWQSARYDRALVLEKECRYFTEAFVVGYLGCPDPYRQLAGDFSLLADRIEKNAVQGFIHRDLQSRNIMVTGTGIRFIDYQGGRLGPVQYDLASLLVDPYVDLPPEVRKGLFRYAADRLAALSGQPPSRCMDGLRYCALSRNLQILGAFGFLTARGKSWFEKSIPGAIAGLNRVLGDLPPEEFPGLSELAKELPAQAAGKRSGA